MSTIHVRPGEGRHYPMIDGDHIAKAYVQDAGGAFEVFEVIAPAAPMAPPHVSPWTGVLYLIEGRITALVDGTSYDVEPGGPVDDVMEEILSVTRRHGVALASS